MKQLSYIVLLFLPIFSIGQDVELFQQLNGRYDYIAIGNTMNTEENGPFTNCVILTSSTASLNLNNNQIVQAAYLYWAGSGTGDFDVNLNGNPISAERTFSDALDDTREFFAAFADVTDLVIAEGNGDYTLSELDLTDVIAPFCPTGTNFAGWAITIVYQDDNLPLNQINVYDGLQSVPTELSITLDNLNVLDDEGAKIGFVAWEGDSALAVNEQLTINGNVIGNPPLNPDNNAFNGTNSFTGQSGLFNMDIDFYDIQNNIDIGDTSATIQLTSGQDFVMINNIITVLNSQLQSTTQADIPIGDSENGSIALTIPDSIPDTFGLSIQVDDDGSGQGIVTEINETNNSTATTISLQIIPPIETLPGLLECDEGFNMTSFDLTELYDSISADPSNISFHLTESDSQTGANPISIPEQYTNITNPQTIYVRIFNQICFETAFFSIEVENCPPFVPEGFSPNEDGVNDDFFISGLRDIFESFELLIYNRYGTLIYKGDNSIPNWNGTANRGPNNRGEAMPTGTYFYVLHLNDPNFKTLTGWVYLNR